MTEKPKTVTFVGQKIALEGGREVGVLRNADDETDHQFYLNFKDREGVERHVKLSLEAGRALFELLLHDSRIYGNMGEIA